MSLMEKQIERQMRDLDPESQKYLEVQLGELQAGDFTGIFNFDDAMYHRGLGVSKSQLDTFAQTPRAFWWKHLLRNDNESNQAMEIGDMVHKAILEPHLVHENYCSDEEALNAAFEAKPDVKSPRSTKAYKDKIEDLRKSGKTILPDENFEMMRAMVENVYSHPKAKNILSNGLAEQCIYAKDPETGLLLRCKADFMLPDGIMVDVKTTSDARPDEFSKSVWNFRYHVQAAYYLHVARLAFGSHFKSFIWICLEKKRPYDIAIYTPDEGTMDYGHQMFKKNLRELANCFEKDSWPGYSNHIEPLALPNWAWNKAEGLV